MSDAAGSRHPGPGLILGNLDVEQDMAAALPPCQRPRGGAETLPAAARRAIAAFATLLRVCARPNDRLWIAEPIDPQVMCEVPGLPRPELLSGPLTRHLEGSGEVLAWGESERISAYRTPAAKPSQTRRRVASEVAGLPLSERLWHLPRARPSVVAETHHRAFAWRLAKDLGIALPGAAMVRDMASLETSLCSLARSQDTPWVVKAPLSAAGRDRIWGRGPCPDDTTRRSLHRLFNRWPEALLEPWMERLDDFGASAVVTVGGVELLGMHGQCVDRKGRFQGVEIWPSGWVEHLPAHPWPSSRARRFEEIVQQVGLRLLEAGYEGPFGIDGFRYRRPDGGLAWNMLGEINVRLTFGCIGRLMVQQLADRLPSQYPVRLRLTTRSDTAQSAPGKHHLQLLAAHRSSRASAWLEAD